MNKKLTLINHEVITDELHYPDLKDLAFSELIIQSDQTKSDIILILNNTKNYVNKKYENDILDDELDFENDDRIRYELEEKLINAQILSEYKKMILEKIEKISYETDS